MHLNLDKWNNEVNFYQHVIERDPYREGGYQGLARGHERQGNMTKAIETLGAGIRLVKDEQGRSDLHRNLGTLLGQQGRLRESERHLRQSLTLSTPHSGAHIGLGNILWQRGDLQAAETQYRQALEISPGNFEAAYNLGLLNQQQQQHTEARHYYQLSLANAGPQAAPQALQAARRYLSRHASP